MVLRVRAPSLGAGAGAAAYTLTAAAGSFTVTPKTANLVAGRVLTASTGSFVTTAKTANLLAGRKLTAATGSLAIAGQPAATLRGYLLTSAAGSFVITGKTANLTRSGRTLTAATGAFTIAAQNAGLIKKSFFGAAFDPTSKGANWTLSNGNYTATMGSTPSSDQNVRTTTTQSSGKYYWEVNVDANVSGFNIGIGVLKTSVTSGAYMGQSTLSVGYGANGNITVNGGTVATGPTWTTGSRIRIAFDATNGLIWFCTTASGTWNGNGLANPATGQVGVTFNPGGPYAIGVSTNTASDGITLKTASADWLSSAPSGFGQWGQLGYVHTAAAGSFAITGQAAGLARTRIMAGSAGSFTITGKTASLVYYTPNRILTADSGSFAVAGKTANFLYGRRLVAANGNFVITGQAATFSTNRWTPVATPGGIWTPILTPTTTWS